jgi:hypothetical protein
LASQKWRKSAIFSHISGSRYPPIADVRQRLYKASLQVNPGGAKFWRQKHRVDGREKKLGIGVYPDVSLSDGR